jgi:hypothetical protein
MRIRTLLLLAGLLLSPMAWAHGGHDPVLFQGWLGWKHWLAHALAAPAVTLGIGAALAGAGLLCWLQIGRAGIFILKTEVDPRKARKARNTSTPRD